MRSTSKRWLGSLIGSIVSSRESLPYLRGCREAVNVAQARRREPTFARIGDEGCSVTPRESQDLRAAMNARLPVVLHSGEMRDDNAPGPSVLHRRSGRVDDLDQNMTLGDVVIPRDLRTGNGEETEFRGTAEIADGDPLLPGQVQAVGVEGAARSDPPTQTMTSEQVRIVTEKAGQTDSFAARRALGKDQRVEIEQFHLRHGREELFRMVAPVIDDTAQSTKCSTVQRARQMGLAVAVEDGRILHRRLPNQHARRRGHQGAPIGIAPETDRGTAAGAARPATNLQIRQTFLRQ